MKKILFIFLLSSQVVVAQNKTHKRLSYGFHFNLTRSNVSLAKATTNNFVYVNDSFGFGLGIFTEYRISNMLSVNLKSDLNFGNTYLYFGSDDDIYDIMQNSIEIKSHFNIQTSTHKNSPYLIIGPNIKLPLYSKEEKKQSTFFTNSASAMIDLGFGINFSKKSVHILPEFVYSFGINNIAIHPFISQLTYHQLALVINFRN